ncbi:CBS domain-containing protein [Celeribacter halophilus]|uniref:CBS domain-containing protein n=1 Tax=Celeribacter halophilus TaxID=576117 RepID=A0AAW7XRH7_9RHOB|nr:CBS domain-containing protein [Celeribacter halophilus]MDO6456932.1 CBS domain-containing protein [Celeribacter halophilus]MDO6723594.1 CBS domain-containing protein [Celeribacter halophilus]
MPASYTPKTRGAMAHEHSHSQTVETNTAAAEATVADVLAQKGADIFAVKPLDTIKHAVELMRDNRIGIVLVKDAQDALVGVLSERDIVRQLADTPGQTLPKTVADLMTRDIETATSQEQLVSVLRRMTDRRFRHMPVIDDGTLVGLISIGDVVSYRLAALEYEALKLKQLIVG